MPLKPVHCHPFERDDCTKPRTSYRISARLQETPPKGSGSTADNWANHNQLDQQRRPDSHLTNCSQFLQRDHFGTIDIDSVPIQVLCDFGLAIFVLASVYPQLLHIARSNDFSSTTQGCDVCGLLIILIALSKFELKLIRQLLPVS